MPCYAGSSLTHPVFATSLEHIIFSPAGFNLVLFCTATCCAGLSLGAIDNVPRSLGAELATPSGLWKCICDIRTTTKSPNNAFPTAYPHS